MGEICDFKPAGVRARPRAAPAAPAEIIFFTGVRRELIADASLAGRLLDEMQAKTRRKRRVKPAPAAAGRRGKVAVTEKQRL